LKTAPNWRLKDFMSNTKSDQADYRDSQNYAAWLLERILEDRAESAPPKEASDE
jgi:hypothetical protein